jgi:hypothetical protein
MTSFHDGPANGKTLTLKRAPLFLRVTVGQDGKIDALDQLDDAPMPDEKILVYRRRGEAGSLHIDGRDKRGRRFGEWYAYGEYDLFAEQPADEILRNNQRWRNWCEVTRDQMLQQACGGKS